MVKKIAIIIGAMKAGTTTLFNHLAGHPEVAGARPKEPGFFAFDEIYAQGAEWYEGLFEFDPGRHVYALEASTDYAKYPHCGNPAARIKTYDAPAKLIYLLRHPLRRIESHARHVQFAGKELGQTPSPIADHSLDAGVSPISMDASRYAFQLDHYKEYFDRGDLLLVSLEQLSARPQETVEKAFRFLGLDPSRAPALVARKNSARQTQRLHRPHPVWAVLRSLPPVRAAVKALVPGAARNRWRNATRPPAKVEGRFVLTAEEELALLKELRPDLTRLRDIYGFDIETEWGIKA